MASQIQSSNSRKMNIAIIDDAKVNAKLIAAYVKKLDNANPTVFTKASDGLTYCLEQDVDIILLDYKMPEIDGLTFIERIRAVPEKSGVPIVMITSVDDRNILRQALDVGANDFLTKPVDEVELTARVRNMLSLRAYALELKQMATIDALTATYNRRYFLDEAEKEFLRSRRYHTPLSILMLDADKFKRINDTYGHASGDIVLSSICDICRSELRSFDFIGRLGGEEFAICLPETIQQEAMQIAERLRTAIENASITTEKGDIRFTVSIGLTVVDCADSYFTDALERADTSLYQAKRNGRNQVSGLFVE